MQGEKIEPWFVCPASTEYFSVESSFSLSQQIQKKIYALVRLTAKYVFFISQAIKIAASFSKFQCLYAMLLLRDSSKHGFSVAYNFQRRNQF